MRKLLKIVSRLKYLGLLGLPMLVNDHIIFKYFWLFWLFAFVEAAIILPSLLQVFHQMCGIIWMSIKYDSPPDKDTFIPNVRYSLPFEGTWVAVNGGVVKEVSHSWDILTQRYAYDFIMLDHDGKSSDENSEAAADYYCYGKNILAPADGVVVEVKDNCNDSAIMGNGKTDPLIKDIRGNYIVIQHGQHEFSVLCHLMPNSIQVTMGQSVKRKEKIAMCGNSGNTSEPHIHFQIQDGISFFTSAGLPIHFDGVKMEECPNYGEFDQRPIHIESGNQCTFISRGQCVSNI